MSVPLPAFVEQEVWKDASKYLSDVRSEEDMNEAITGAL